MGIDNSWALDCYKAAAHLGHYGAFKQAGNLLYPGSVGHEEMLLNMTSDKQIYLNKAEEFSLEIKIEGNKLFEA